MLLWDCLMNIILFLGAHAGDVNSLMFTEDGYHILSFGTDNEVRLWDTLKGQQKIRYFDQYYNNSKKHVTMVMSPGTAKEHIFFIPSKNNINCIDLKTGTFQKRLQGHFGKVNCCVYDNRTLTLYSSGTDKNILSWTTNRTSIKVYEEEVEKKKREEIDIVCIDTWSSEESDG